jgi:hypothetical protein
MGEIIHILLWHLLMSRICFDTTKNPDPDIAVANTAPNDVK